MLLGIFAILGGGVLAWMVNWILGGMLILAGLVQIGLTMIRNSEPEIERTSYDYGPKTYDLRSKPKSQSR